MLLFYEPLIHELTFVPFENTVQAEVVKGSLEDVYIAFQNKERLLFQKIAMIEKLTPWHEQAQGILHMDLPFKKGMALLSEEIFSIKPVTDVTERSTYPFVIYRKEGPYVDIAQVSSHVNATIVIGYSFSSIAQEIARMLERPVLLLMDKKILQGFKPQGENLPQDELTVKGGSDFWKGIEYVPYNIPLQKLTVSILIPKSELMALQTFLKKVRNELIEKISSNLLIIILVLLAVSLFFVARISRKITKPITQLAKASEEIGKGKYHNLDLP